MKVIVLALFAAIAMPLSAHAMTCAPASGDRTLDQAIASHRYMVLEQGIAADPKLQHSYFAGVLDNHRARYERSRSELLQSLPALRSAADCARLGYAYITLADDYRKQYHYADAAGALAEALPYRSFLSTQDADDITESLPSLRAMGFAPPQTTTLSSAFVVPLTEGKIDVSVNGRRQPFIFDTGAGITTMSESAARHAGIAISPHVFMTHGSTGAPVAGHLAVTDFTIGGNGGKARILNAVVLVLPDRALYIAVAKLQLDAILGYPVISALGAVQVRPASIRIERSDPAAAQPNIFFDGSSPLVQASVDGQQGLMLFDTGADVTRLYSAYYALHPNAVVAPKHPTYTAGIGGVTRITTVAPHASVTIGGRSTVLSEVPVFSKALNREDRYLLGQLGVDFFKPFGGYTLDFSRATLRVAGGMPPSIPQGDKE